MPLDGMIMMIETNLIPCPNCKSHHVRVTFISVLFHLRFYAECLDCWFTGGKIFPTREQAIDYWNSGAKEGYMLGKETK